MAARDLHVNKNGPKEISNIQEEEGRKERRKERRDGWT
ncbi:hypothetical protein L345_02717, partial [Ophiophagus hannah]